MPSGHPERVPDPLAGLKSPDVVRRRAAIEAVIADTVAAGRGADPTAALPPHRRDADASTPSADQSRDRPPAVRTDASDVLLDHLENEPDALNRLLIIRYLGWQLHLPAGPTLRRIMHDPEADRTCRRAAADAVDRIALLRLSGGSGASSRHTEDKT